MRVSFVGKTLLEGRRDNLEAKVIKGIEDYEREEKDDE